MLSEATIEIINNISKILENENIQVTVSTVGRAGLVAAGCTIVGGFVGGPVGIAVGGLAGTAVNRYLTPKFVPITQVIQKNMTDEQKSNLAQLVTAVVQKVSSSGAIKDLLANDSAKSAVISVVLAFVQNQGFGTAVTCPKC